MKVIDRTKAETLHFLDNSFKKIQIKIKIEKSKTQTISVSNVFLFCVFCSVLHVFVRAILSWCP